MIRRYKSTDNDEVKELHWLGLAEIGVQRREGNPMDQDLNNIEAVYLKDGDFLVCEMDGRVVGMGAIKRKDDKTAEVKRMRVHPDYQRHGVGSAIMFALEKRAKEIGYTRMYLDTSEKWVKAQKFYSKLGFKETGRAFLHGFYHAIFYEKEII